MASVVLQSPKGAHSVYEVVKEAIKFYEPLPAITFFLCRHKCFEF